MGNSFFDFDHESTESPEETIPSEKSAVQAMGLFNTVSSRALQAGQIGKSLLTKTSDTLKSAAGGLSGNLQKSVETSFLALEKTADSGKEFAQGAFEQAQTSATNLAPILDAFGQQTKTMTKKFSERTQVAAKKAQNTWILTCSAVGDATQVAGDHIADMKWVRDLNGLWDNDPLIKAITRAMDNGFKIGEIDPGTLLKITPRNHRILIDGHTLGQSITHAREMADQQGAGHAEALIAWMKAYLEDLSSPAGMPLGDWSKHVYAALREAGWKEEAARNLVTINGSGAIDVLLTGTLSGLSLALVFSKQEQETFSRALGILGMGAVVSTNPIAGLMTIAALAIGYKRDLLQRAALEKGAFVKLIGFSVNFLLPGPAIATAIVGIAVTIYLDRNLQSELPLAEQLQAIVLASYSIACEQVASMALPGRLEAQA